MKVILKPGDVLTVIGASAETDQPNTVDTSSETHTSIPDEAEHRVDPAIVEHAPVDQAHDEPAPIKPVPAEPAVNDSTPSGLSLVDLSTLNINAQDGGTIKYEDNTVVANYPAGDGSFAWVVLPLNGAQSAMVTFKARMSAIGGLKFVKFFSENIDGGYANVTFGIDYNSMSGRIEQVAFGDGTSIENDSNNVINLNGQYPEWIGRSYPNANVEVPNGVTPSIVGETLHEYTMYVKFNDPGINNGECYLEVDGKLHCRATGLYNRNDENGNLDRVEFLGWTQNGKEPFAIEIRDIMREKDGDMPVLGG